MEGNIKNILSLIIGITVVIFNIIFAYVVNKKLKKCKK
jgi:hypothetical protein